MVRPIDKYIVDGFRDDPDSMAVVEQLLERYFDKYMATEIDHTRAELYHKQADLLRTPMGPLAQMANASNPAHFEDRLSRELITNGHKDIFLNPEELVLLCKRQLRMNQSIREDLTQISQAWRHSAILKIGQEEYDRISKQMHQDLAVSYMDYRLSELILKKMVKEQAPKSSVDYVVRKASEGSLFGIARSLNRTPMQMRIDQEAEKLSAPSKGEKVTARAISVALDAPMTGALTCWGSLIGVGALEVAMELAQPVLMAQIQGKPKQVTVEQILSQKMFHSEEDEFAKMRSASLDYITETSVINTLGQTFHNSPFLFEHTKPSQNLSFFIPEGSEYTVGSYTWVSPEASPNFFEAKVDKTKSPANSKHSKPSPKVPTQSASSSSFTTSPSSPSSPSSSSSPETAQTNFTSSSKTTPLSKDSIPPKRRLIISPVAALMVTDEIPDSDFYEEDNIQPISNADKNPKTFTKGTDAHEGDEQGLFASSSDRSELSETTDPANPNPPIPEEKASQNILSPNPVRSDEDQEMASQWAPLIARFGLKDIKGVGANLGLILATLPDMLFGMFSKKDENPEFSWARNLIPLASLLMGFKFRNPLLKMLLVGYGGVGLIKNSMENLNSEDSQKQSATSARHRPIQFVPYAEQPLNPRIENLQINQNILVMDIDKVPYTVTLPDTVVMAYKQKSLPLSTLGNAVLQKYDLAVAQNPSADQNRGIHPYNPDMDLQPGKRETVTIK